ncbi:unnamed protein product [Spirodela intermedia]|uniref:non-specific serine/threonine protein kinase n=1 Tax=Spirodela intermedia TaxID=51605 RepID=A0A7I8JZW9_SPIIN|nr:unnamed protein product [Spirodela intermedia]
MGILRWAAPFPLPLLLLLSWLPAMASAQSASCPLNFTLFQKYVDVYKAASDASANGTINVSPCQFTLQGIHLCQAEYLRTSGLFLPALNSSASCWAALQLLLDQIFTDFNPRSACGFKTEWISTGCMNISSRSQFESLAKASSSTVLADVNQTCSGSVSGSTCATCTATITRLNAFLTGPPNGNVSDCTQYPFIYVAGAVNRFGPANEDTALCCFALSANPDTITPSVLSSGGRSGTRGWLFGVIGGVLFLLVVAGIGFWFVVRKRRHRRKRRKKKIVGPDSSRTAAHLEYVGASTTLVRYTFDEIKAATENFSRGHIIGKGGYGNVYRGLLPDGTEVALKRFKNCSAAGDEDFRHEVEVIASVRHVNLVGLRGYCIATTPLEGHQRIIVCDLMKNGSLHDHLFGWASTAREMKLSWPIRQKIAVGTARGIAYLHYGVTPSIIHRDIKASNILLDDEFEPKVADFGLAKFAPEGVSHVSTRVAGTLGYVAPEYALYGQLTERSDVYSFGVLLLELLSGKKPIISSDGEQTSLVTDWAWSLVREGRTLDVIEEGMPELGSSEVMEKYVMVAVLASHPQLYARPLMDKIVKILETDLVVPTIPDRPIPLTSNLMDIEKSVSSSGSGHLSSFSGYQSFALGKDDTATTTE